VAFSLNKIMLIGNLGGDAENRMTTNDVSVTSFSLATTYSYKGRDGNWVNETTWHKVVAYRLSDYMKEQLKKGKKFYVEGRLTKRSYENKEGKTVYVTEVISERLIPLDSSGGGSSFGGTEEPGGTYQSSGETSAENPENDLPF
jgi:single-strand DNA-binding protein